LDFVSIVDIYEQKNKYLYLALRAAGEVVTWYRLIKNGEPVGNIDITAKGFSFMDVETAHRQEVLTQLKGEVTAAPVTIDGADFLFVRPRGTMLEMLVHLRHVLNESAYDLADDLSKYNDRD